VTRELDEAELRLRLIVTEERARVRRRYSRMATAELNASVPRIEHDFYEAVQAGRLPDLRDFFPIDSGETDEQTASHPRL